VRRFILFLKSEAVKKIKSLLKILYIQVLIATALAVLFGHFYPEQAIQFKPLGDCFIKLIKMCIGPLIFCTIVTGIVGMEDLKELGKIGIKMIIYFEVLTSIALIIGYLSVTIIKPGSGMNVDLSAIDSSSLKSYAHRSSENVVDFVQNIIPTTFIDAFAKGEILPILFIAILFGFALSVLKKESEVVINGIQQLMHIIFKIINFIMKLSPLGAFGAMSYTIGQYGIGSLSSLGYLILTYYTTCLLFVFVILGAVAAMCGFNIWKLLKYIKEEIFLVFGTSSSETALPLLMKKLEKVGCPKSIVGITIPAGYSFNLDGSCIFFTTVIIFIAQAGNIHLTFLQEMNIILILLLTSKGATGVTGSGLIVAAATLSVIDTVPLAGLTLILGIYRFLSEGMAVTSLIGNSVATIAISRWEKQVSSKKINEELNKPNQIL
jgi:aerobic C4-dicarboxylate transport protein